MAFVIYRFQTRNVSNNKSSEEKPVKVTPTVLTAGFQMRQTNSKPLMGLGMEGYSAL